MSKKPTKYKLGPFKPRIALVALVQGISFQRAKRKWKDKNNNKRNFLKLAWKLDPKLDVRKFLDLYTKWKLDE